MWKIDESSALEVCIRFSSMSLCKLYTANTDNGDEEYNIHIHDLHLDFVRRIARKSSVEWHRRLLNGHILPGTFATPRIDGSLVLGILKYTPRAWRKENVSNREYIRRNICRHLHIAVLGLELWAVVLNLRWIHAEVQNGGILGWKDCDLLKSFVEKESCEQISITMINTIVDVLQAASLNISKGLRVLSFIFLLNLSPISETDELLARFLHNVKEAVQTPYLTPVVSAHRRRQVGLQAAIHAQKSKTGKVNVHCADFSNCERYLVAGRRQDIVVMGIDI